MTPFQLDTKTIIGFGLICFASLAYLSIKNLSPEMAIVGLCEAPFCLGAAVLGGYLMRDSFNLRRRK